MILGMTGTRVGMTSSQRLRAISYLEQWKPKIVIHGCCIGADQDFHIICRHYISTRIEGYPASDFQLQWAQKTCDCLYTGYTYKERDLIMAQRADKFLAFPSHMTEIKRSGTWMTVRMRRKEEKHLLIIFPDGTEKLEIK